MKDSATITSYGGAGTVTGANFLFDTGSKKILIDCGAFEREHVCDPSNLAQFAYDPASIDALFVTHAHADHIGRIPKLVHDGFKGEIFSTSATRDLAALMFDDALRVMRTEVERHGCSMMYEEEDAAHALELWRTVEYHQPFSLEDAEVECLDAGHILGSMMVRFTRNSRNIIFTGDLGNSPEPLLNDTESPHGAQYILMESVYGDRLHKGVETRSDALRAAIEGIRTAGGALLIPSFSIERTQILLFEIRTMLAQGLLAPIPVYLDAPLAIRVTEVFRTHRSLLKESVRALFEEGKDPFAFDGLEVIKDNAQSEAIHNTSDPKIIIAGAGMSSGGRIRSHEKKYLPDARASVLFVGYQAPGSLGQRIQSGEKQVRIDGDDVAVNASIETLEGYSGHKDQAGLLSFVKSAGPSLEKVFVAMGEAHTEEIFAQEIRNSLHIDAIVPSVGEVFEINW